MTSISQTALRTQLTLAALPTAVPCMRLHAKQMAWEWGLGGLAETVELLVSELTTNAIKAAQELKLRSRPSDTDISAPCVGLQLSSDGQRVLIEVWDANPDPPAPAVNPDPGAESGKGLFLVEALSERWGYYHPQQPAEPVNGYAGAYRQPAAAPVFPSREETLSKVVWCEVTLRSSMDSVVPSEKSV
jgi:anti-sigma regulatory factor (Ser/Thr protein kinase)